MSETAKETISRLIRETKLARPNPDQTWLNLLDELDMDERLYGNSYVWIVRDKTEAVTGVFRIPPVAVCFVQEKGKESYYRLKFPAPVEKVVQVVMADVIVSKSNTTQTPV